MTPLQRARRRDDGLDAAVEAVREHANDLAEPADLDPIVERAGEASRVAIGEASHGTSEFYGWRATLTARLIREGEVGFVGVEGDWTDCYRIDRFVRGREDAPDDAREVLDAFDRWPTWMWANREVVGFLEWLREYNDGREYAEQVGFYGLDVYGLYESMGAILAYLEDRDPELAERARDAYQCFEPYGEDAREYARSTRLVPEHCEDEVIDVLADLRREHPASDGFLDEDAFAAEQNALVVRNAEDYRGQRESPVVHDVDETRSVSFAHQNAKRSGGGRESRPLLLHFRRAYARRGRRIDNSIAETNPETVGSFPPICTTRCSQYPCPCNTGWGDGATNPTPSACEPRHRGRKVRQADGTARAPPTANGGGEPDTASGAVQADTALVSGRATRHTLRRADVPSTNRSTPPRRNLAPVGRVGTADPTPNERLGKPRRSRRGGCHYRKMARGGGDSWNARDEHMADTVDRLADRPDVEGAPVLWAHNTHVGDARATDMADRGKLNLGQLLRERDGADDVHLVGMGTHRGSVIAGQSWDAPAEEMRVPEATETSYGDVFHRAGVGDAALVLDGDGGDEGGGDLDALEPRRGHRAIGVVYHPERELGNYVPTSLPERYDSFLHVEETAALQPLHGESREQREREPPETFPWGV